MRIPIVTHDVESKGLSQYGVSKPFMIVPTEKKTLDDGRVHDLKEDTRPVEIGSFRYDYFPWSVSLQALVSKEKRLYGLPNNFPVNDPNFVDTIRKLYADWKREANKSFDPIRNKYPVVFEEE